MCKFYFVLLTFLACGCSDGSTSPTDGDVTLETGADVAQSDDIDVAQSDGDAESDTEGIQYAFMAVHLDPGSIPVDPVGGGPNTSRARDYFRSLVELVLAADLGGHKLTIMFHAQWSVYVDADECMALLAGVPGGQYEYQGVGYESCHDLVRAIEANGHEIAMHHHPLTAPSSWDGFTNQTSWTADRDHDNVDETYHVDGSGPDGSDPWYLGDLDAMMAYHDSIPVGGRSNIVSATTEEYPTEILFSAAGGPEAYVDADTPGDLVSAPCATDFEGYWVWQIRMRSYTSPRLHDTVQAELPKALADFDGFGDEPWVVGFVTHAKNVGDIGIDPYQDLFDQLTSSGLTLETVNQVMGHYSYTADDAGLADSSRHCE